MTSAQREGSQVRTRQSVTTRARSARGGDGLRQRQLAALPKAHLHLHFTGSMRHHTLLELAERDGIHLPDSLVSEWPPQLSAADEKGWFRFQRLYDVARSVLRTEGDVRRLVREAAEDDVRDGGRWLEIQVDPSGYAARFGGITAFTDLVLDAVAEASRDTGLGIALVVAANRTRHPLDARTLARLAAQYAGRGVVGFGLSNDERRGSTADFGPGLRDRRPRRAAAGAARRRAARTRPRTDLPRHAPPRPARPRRALGRGPRAARGDRGGRHRPRGLPGLQRRARRLLRPDLGAAAGAARRGRHGRPRAPTTRCSSGPAWPASTPRCAPPTSSPTTSSPSWPGCPSAPRAPPPTVVAAALAADRRLARRPGLICRNGNRSCALESPSDAGWPA